MSGDVQPRKRKDKKRKKDEVGLEEHRGTAATFAEGEMQMHSHQEHGTGGHWCAKIIFFSLLAVLVTLIGLIILENRGLTELEANSVESQYSGLLDGWIEDTADDDHHDEHTLDLKHHQENEDIDEHEIHEFDDDDDDTHDNDDEHDEELDHDEVEEDEDGGDNDGSDEDGDDEDEEENDSQEVNDDEDEVENASQEVDDDDDDDDDDENQEDADDEGYDNDFDSNEDEDGEIEKLNIETTENRYSKPDDDEDDNDDEDDDNDNDDDDDDDDDDNDDDETGVVEGNDDGDDDNDSNETFHHDDGNDAQSVENDDDDEENSKEEQDDEDDDEHEEDLEGEAEEEIEKIEKEVSDQEEPESAEIVLPDVVSAEKEEETSVEVMSPDEEYEDDKEFLEVDDLNEPAVERIEAPPPGKPFVEIEDEVSTETSTPDTLAEEEEYEKQQEELRQQEAQSTLMWLKLAVGGALLAATHAVLRRATAPRDTPENEQDEHASREETPLTDRRMTLLPDESSKVIPPQSLQPKVEEEIVQKIAPVVKAAAVQKQESEEVEDDEVIEEEDQEVNKNDDKIKELYSDEDEIEDDEEVDDEEEVEETKEVPKPILKVASAKKEPEPEPEEIPDDVEIIDDEQIEEEVEEEIEDEEEISDVDDAELLTRLEAKYGRLPEPERPGQRHKDGGNSLEDDWPGEPSDPYWKKQLEKAEQELRQGAYGACEARTSDARLAGSGRARWLRARALDQLAEERRDNKILTRAIAAYMKLLEMNERLSDKKLLEVALRTVDRIQFRGTYINAEPVYRLLIRRFPNDVTYRNNLTITFLMANRADLASEVLKETLRLWPDDRVALAHYGFILKTEQNKLEEAVTYFQRALAGDAGAANDPRFYYHLGEALLMLGRKDEAHEVHKRGTALGHFLSPSQRSLYNVPRLKSKPWWDVWSTPYAGLARELEASWREILKEGEAAQSLYEKEKEGLRERGEWSQLELFVRGREVAGRCERAPVTCRIVKKEPAAQCRRGQVKFSLMSAGSHVRAHVGPTNCRLRLHLALANTDRTYLRVDQETRQWQTGKVLMFDDSFEHEVWHNGSRARLVLIVDVWHPDLSPRERLTLPAI